MRTKHHRLPKCFRRNKEQFYDLTPRRNISWVSDLEHKAWNIITRNSQMTLGETIESLNRFIPADMRFVLVKNERR